MKKFLLLSLLVLSSACVMAQFKASTPRSWNRFPPEVQKPGFGMVTSQVVKMDGGQEDVEVFLFSADNGHYPSFDIFKCYYVMIGNYSKEVKFTSDITLSTNRDLVLEDRNNDGVFELYRRYMKDGKFTVDENGDKLRADWVYDKIEWSSSDKKSK